MSNEMNDQPLRLAELAAVDAPEVVRVAVRRFRRRVAVWGIWIVGAIVVVALAFPALRPYRDLAARMSNAPGESLGRVIERPFLRMTVIDVRRLDEKTVAVHVLATSDALHSNENLQVDPFFGGGNEATAKHNGGKRFSQQRGAGSVVEAWFAVLPGTQSFDVEVFSAGGDAGDGNSQRAPGQPQADPKKLATRPAVITDTITLDFRALGVAESIWR
jgi:hypothetical protein